MKLNTLITSIFSAALNRWAVGIPGFGQVAAYTMGLMLLMGCQGSNSPQQGQKAPNIVMIVTDDLGWHDLSCYGNTFIETPHIDALAKQGTRFTDAYAASALCSPSRASIMTGLHPIRLNITEHIHGNQPAGKHQPLATPPIDQFLNKKHTTLGEALSKQGYATGFIGKWHLGGGQHAPHHRGFGLNVAGAWNGLPKSFFYPFFNEGEKPTLQNAAKPGEYLTDALTGHALRFIAEHQDSAFFLSLNYYAPHVPIEAPEDLVKKYQQKRLLNPEDSLPNIHYAAMIARIDANVGRVMRCLDSLGLADNTLVLFTSDNGGLSVKEVPAFAKHTPPTDNGPLRAGKGYLYEGGIREPLIARWPKAIKPGQTNHTPVIGQDFFNTLMEVAGSTERSQDGLSLYPLFAGNSIEQRGLLWHLPHYSPQHGKPVSAYRKGDWKLIYFYEDERYELYNLKEDISESRDLSAKHQVQLEALKENMQQQLNSLAAKYPSPNPKYIGKKTNESQ